MDKITTEKAIDEMIQKDINESSDDTLSDIFYNGTPGYRGKPDEEIRQLYRDYIDPTENENYIFDFK